MCVIHRLGGGESASRGNLPTWRGLHLGDLHPEGDLHPAGLPTGGLHPEGVCIEGGLSTGRGLGRSSRNQKRGRYTTYWNAYNT